MSQCLKTLHLQEELISLLTICRAWFAHFEEAGHAHVGFLLESHFLMQSLSLSIYLFLFLFLFPFSLSLLTFSHSLSLYCLLFIYLPITISLSLFSFHFHLHTHYCNFLPLILYLLIQTTLTLASLSFFQRNSTFRATSFFFHLFLSF